MENGKSLKDVVTHIHRKIASLAFIVTLRVAWPNLVGITIKFKKMEGRNTIRKLKTVDF